jgi:hypothetical protein
MDSTLFAKLETALRTEGAAAALDRLCATLRQEKDYDRLFYALLMKKRHELGVGLLPVDSIQDLPESLHAPMGEAVRQAERLVGELYLQAGNLPQAWAYFRMLGEPEPVRAALEKYQPAEGEDVQALVQIAFYQGAHPCKGFDWILERYGLCNAITTLSGQELSSQPEVRQHCIQALVRALYAELRDRLAAEIERHEGRPPQEAEAPPGMGGVVRRLMAGRDWLFEEGSYHIDTSHLSSVVQMSVHLTPCAELDLARELCHYGRRLSGVFQGTNEPPFEDLYGSHDTYLSILAGADVEKGLDYFRAQADNADPETVGTYPAEVLVNLLLQLGREEEALAVARKHLAQADSRRLTCPGVAELCQKVGDYRALAEAARGQGDVLHFMAGLLEANASPGR